jgi:hypothetical protein
MLLSSAAFCHCHWAFGTLLFNKIWIFFRETENLSYLLGLGGPENS